uniref:Uncharacterized protein n=1 Tax=Opuntia streptacantha TaxID=393608 RepID=A0A7C8Z0T7_OPUST
MASVAEQQELPPELPIGVPRMVEKHEQSTKNKWRRLCKHGGRAANSSDVSPINSLDDGCLMHVFSFLSPIPDGVFWHATHVYGYELIGLLRMYLRLVYFPI